MKYDNTVADDYTDRDQDGELYLYDWNVTSTSLYTVFEDIKGTAVGYAVSKFSLDGVLDWS